MERQGPGSREMTLKALSFVKNPNNSAKAADLGCGTGGQTMTLAEAFPGSIVGVDISSDFIKVFNVNTEEAGIATRVKGIVGSMDNLPFHKAEFDLIWSEGAIDNMGFEKGLTYWRIFLKENGYISVTCPSWFTDKHPAEVEKFWADAGSRLDSIEHNIGVMKASGYSFIAAFVLPEVCWVDNYFIPRTKAENVYFQKYPENRTIKEYIDCSRYELDLYTKYKQHYGYVFYIGRKT